MNRKYFVHGLPLSGLRAQSGQRASALYVRPNPFRHRPEHKKFFATVLLNTEGNGEDMDLNARQHLYCGCFALSSNQNRLGRIGTLVLKVLDIDDVILFQ